MSESIGSLVARLQGPILVVGASGFVGANLLRTILEYRLDVVGTRYSSNSWRLAGIPTESTDYLNLSDPVSIHDVLTKHRPRTIFDCSAYGAYSFETDSERIHDTNYLGVLRMLGELRNLQIAAYVHAGSSSEYGFNCDGPLETAELRPNSHYAVSKVGAAAAISYFGTVEKLPVASLRLYSVYGPWEDSSRLIPQMCIQSLAGRFPKIAPDVTRDFVYVEDVTRAFLLTALNMNEDMFGLSINIGSGESTSLREVTEKFHAEFALETSPEYDPAAGRNWDTRNWRANSQRASDLLGWSPRIDLATGLRLTRQWWADHESVLDSPTTTSKYLPKQSQKSSITAIVACYRDAQAIPIMYERLTKVLQKVTSDYEIIFVNDCSPDDSEEVIRGISAIDWRVRGITHSRNFGSQAAFRSGMEVSRMESCVLLDGDLQDPPELIEEFANLWRAGNDVVYGRRVKREMSPMWDRMYKAFYALFDWSAEISIPRNAGDFSLMDQRVVRWLLQCPERDALIRGLRAYVGFQQTGVDYVRPDRLFGTSTNSLFRNIGWAKKAIFSYSRLPLHALTSIGAICLALSALLAVLSTVIRIVWPDQVPQGVTFLSLLIALFGSFTVFGLGLLGEYIGKILEETKARPHFIRSHMISRGQVRLASVARPDQQSIMERGQDE